MITASRRAAFEGDLVGLDATAAGPRLVGRWRGRPRDLRPRTAAPALSFDRPGGPSVAGQDPGRPFPGRGSGGRRGEPGSTPRPPPVDELQRRHADCRWRRRRRARRKRPSAPERPAGRAIPGRG